MIQEEYEQYRRQRKQELENRSRKQPQASGIVATKEDALSTSKEEDAVVVPIDVTASEMSATATATPVAIATAEEDAPLAPIEATTPEMVETAASAVKPITEAPEETLNDGIKQLSKEPNEGTLSRLLLQYGSDAVRIATEEELIKIRRRHGATNKLLRVMEWL